MGKSTREGAFNCLVSHGETEVKITVKWTFYLLEWRFEHTPLLFRALFALLAMASAAIPFLDVVLIRRFVGWPVRSA